MTEAGMNPFLKDIVQVSSWLVAIIAGIVVAVRAIREVRANRNLRAEDLRWRRASLAREILEQFEEDSKYCDVGVMLDWTGREFEIAPDRKEVIETAEVQLALRIHDEHSHFNMKEVYIRDCFDAFFDSLEQVEHYLRTGLIDFTDVEYPLEYQVHKLKELGAVVPKFMKTYGYDLATEFVKRFTKKGPSQRLE